MWRRAAAFLIDLLPLAAVAAVENAAGLAEHAAVGFLNFLCLTGYFSGMNYYYGGTIGKRSMGLRVALPQSPEVVWRLIIRAIVKIICLFPPLATIYGLIAVWRRDGKSPADFVAGTSVVDAATLRVPERLSLPERLLASVVILAAPLVFLLFVLVALFGVALIEELLKNP